MKSGITVVIAIFAIVIAGALAQSISFTQPTTLAGCLAPAAGALITCNVANDPNNRERFDHFLLQEALNELAARGLLIADGASRLSKPEEYYYASRSFMELIEKARNTVKGSTGT